MSLDPFLKTADFDRNFMGQPLVVPKEGGKAIPYRRASNFASMLPSNFGLEKWQKECVAKGVVKDPGLIEKAAASQDPRDFSRVVQEMFVAGGGDAAAKLGTSIHDCLAQLDQGTITLDEVPSEFRPHAEHWQAALEAHGLEVIPEYVELTLVCDEFQVAGSADNLARRKSDGALVVIDKKTGKSIQDRPISYAVQLFLYANSEIYDLATNTRTPININTDVAYLFHLPSSGSGCDVYEVNLNGTTREAAELASAIHQIRVNFEKVSKRKTEPLVTIAPDAASLARIAWIKDRIRTVLTFSEASKQHLLRTWPPQIPPFKGGHQHTDDEISKLVPVLEKIEIFYDLPFGPCDPDAARMEEREIFLIKQTFPEATPIDDSGDVDSVDIQKMTEILNALPDKSKTFISAVAKEASVANRPLSLTQCPSPRRYEIAQALISLSLFEDFDVVRAITSLIEPEALTDASLGRIFGGLQIEQAQHLQKIAHALDSELLTLAFNDAGTPEIRGDVQAIIAA